MEVLNDDPNLVKVVESLTCGKIFAVEILDKADIPLVVLYDTSGDDDININATCLKAMHDKSLEVHLQVRVITTAVFILCVRSTENAIDFRLLIDIDFTLLFKKKEGN